MQQVAICGREDDIWTVKTTDFLPSGWAPPEDRTLRGCASLQLRILVVNAGRNGGADPQHEAVECSIDQPGDTDHASDGKHE